MATCAVLAHRSSDSFFFASPPEMVLQAALMPRTAVVPGGDEWGGDPARLGVCDRMTVGGAAAFAADSTIWETLQPGGNYLLNDAYTTENVMRKAFEHSGITIFKVLMAYCTVSAAGQCRYAEHLVNSLDILGPPLLHRLGKVVCPCKVSRACQRAVAATSRPVDCLNQIQTMSMRSRDPGFCNLVRKCECCTSMVES